MIKVRPQPVKADTLPVEPPGVLMPHNPKAKVLAVWLRRRQCLAPVSKQKHLPRKPASARLLPSPPSTGTVAAPDMGLIHRDPGLASLGLGHAEVTAGT